MTGVDVSFTEDDYQGSESSQSITVRITKNRRIATPMNLTVNPITVEQAEGLGVSIDISPINRAGIIL